VAEVSQTRGNIGEWSELLALATLLVNGGSYAADENQNPIDDLYFKVLQVIISAHDLQGELKYEIQADKIHIYENNLLIEEIERKSISNHLEFFFQELNSGKARKTFSLESGNRMLKLLHKRTISAGSGERETDFSLVIADIETGGPTPRFGFSIKSQLGQASTLLNSSGSTNIIYELIPENTEANLLIPDISETPSSHPQNIRRILDSGFRLEYSSYQSEIFEENLRYVDSQLPEHLAKVLLESYINDQIKSFAEISERIFPVSDKSSEQPLFKLKEFLGAVSMGLRPGTKWKGNASKFKGLMVVKDDGSLIFYYMNSRLNFEEYLFRNLRFERPSTKRHKYGALYTVGNSTFIKLNIQIRFNR
jgi:hypothetical protein